MDKLRTQTKQCLLKNCTAKPSSEEKEGMQSWQRSENLGREPPKEIAAKPPWPCTGVI